MLSMRPNRVNRVSMSFLEVLYRHPTHRWRDGCRFRPAAAAAMAAADALPSLAGGRSASVLVEPDLAMPRCCDHATVSRWPMRAHRSA